MAKQMKWVWGVGAMLLALAAGGLTAYWFVGRQGGAGGLPVGSRAIPDDVLMTLTFSTDEAEWQRLRQMGTQDSQERLNQYIATWRDRLLTDLDLSYQQDIAPWVGEAVTVAFLDSGADQVPELDGSSGASPNPFDPAQMDLGDRAVAWILPIAQPVAAQAVLAELNSAGASEREYQGFEIYQFEGSEDQSYWATVLDRKLVAIATGAADLEAVIQAYGDGDSVADVPGYRQAAQQVAAAQPFLRAYINSDKASGVAAANAASGEAPSVAPLRKESQGIAATASLGEAGIEIDGVTWLKSGVGQTFTGSPVENVAEFLPADTVLVMAGGNLQRLWQDLQQDTQTTGFLTPDSIRGLVNGLTGLSVDEDLIPWMGDEYGLALIAGAAGVRAGASDGASNTAGAASSGEAASGDNGGMALVLQIKAGDRSAAEAALGRLDEAVRSRYEFQIAQNVVQGQPTVQWTSPLAALQITRGWVDDDRVSVVAGAASPLLSGAPLSQSERFQQAIAQASTPTGYFFVNPQRLIALDRGLPLPSVPPPLQSAAEAIEAIGLTTTIPSDRTLRFDVSVLLNQLENPGTLPAPGEAARFQDSPTTEDQAASDDLTEPQ